MLGLHSSIKKSKVRIYLQEQLTAWLASVFCPGGQRSGVPAQVTDQGDVVRGVSHAGQSLIGSDLLVGGQRNHLLHLHAHKRMLAFC